MVSRNDDPTIREDSGMSSLNNRTEEIPSSEVSNEPIPSASRKTDSEKNMVTDWSDIDRDNHAEGMIHGDSEKGPLPVSVSGENGTEASSKYPVLSAWRTTAIIFVLTAVNFTCSMSNGLVTIGIPHIAADTNLPNHLLLWSV